MVTFSALKGHCAAEMANFCSADFSVVSPNATKYTTKLQEKIIKSKAKAVILERKCRISRIEVDYSS